MSTKKEVRPSNKLVAFREAAPSLYPVYVRRPLVVFCAHSVVRVTHQPKCSTKILTMINTDAILIPTQFGVLRVEKVKATSKVVGAKKIILWSQNTEDRSKLRAVHIS